MEDLQLLDDLDNELMLALTSFEESFPSIFDEIEVFVAEFLAELGFSKKRTREELIANVRVINQFRSALYLKLSQGKYAKEVLRLIDGLGRVEEVLDKYFGLIMSNRSKSQFDSSKDFYKTLYQQMILEARLSLLGAGLSANVVNPLVDKLYVGLLHGISKPQLIKELRVFLEKENLPTRWIKQQAHDTLWQFTRNYQQAVSADLGIEHYLYAGTQIATSRDFCKSRIGKVYTKEEVESWVGLNWSGKVPSTSIVSIFVYAGGYNCRHTFRPISKNLYDKLKA